MIGRAVYFFIGFVLSVLTGLAYAQNVPATPSTIPKLLVAPYTSFNGNGTTALEACKQSGSVYDTATRLSTDPASPNFRVYRCTIVNTPGWQGTITDVYATLICPSGTPAGDGSGYCHTKTCPSGYDGPKTIDGVADMCSPLDKCAASKDKYTSGWVSYTGDKVATGTVCIGDCNYEQNMMLDQDDRIGTDGRKWAQVGQTGLGTSCTGSTTPSMEPDQKNKDSKKPPCAATEGVLTTSTGKVLCVPEGTPDGRKPDVKVKTKTETFPDNTTKQTTETTTRDPLTGATSTSTSSTSTGKADGTEGQAGPVGTTTGSSTSGSGNGDGDGEGCDPTLNFCGGPGTDGMYTKKEKTMSSVFTQFQNTVKNSPVGSASTDFFTVSTPGGSCPAWSVQVPMLNVTLNAGDYFCNSTILAALQGAGYVMLALATYIAFTWAFL